VEAPGLTPVERFNVRLVERWHSVPALSRFSGWLARNFARREFELILSNILEDHHFERLEKGNYDNGIMVCANHRSYVDNFAVAIRSMRYIPRDVRMTAPARTEGLFDKPWGIFLNFFLTYMNMYPPVVRSSRGALWGKQVMQILTDLLRRGRTAVFIHPEGGRNKGPDPYHLMPAKPGLSKIIHSTRCDVFPVFLQGFPRKPGEFIKANYRRGARSEPLVHAVMGEPLDFSAERALPASPEAYREIGRRLMEAIAELSEEEREIRARRSIPSSTETRGS
jgi:1-acyl-sn-glycerol-3-phosphate acyltransferase